MSCRATRLGGSNHLDPLLDGCELLLGSWGSGHTKVEESGVVPGLGQAEELSDTLLDGLGALAVVLQVGAVSLELESGPDVGVQHARGVGVPHLEGLGVHGHLVAPSVDDGFVREEKNGAVSGLEDVVDLLGSGLGVVL